MRFDDRQGDVDPLAGQRIEMVGMQFVIRRGSHAAAGRQETGGRIQQAAAGPAEADLIEGTEHFLAAMGTQPALIQSSGQACLPLARVGAAAGIVHAGTQGLLKQRLQMGWIDRPGEQGGGMVDGIGTIALIIEIKNEHRILAVEAPAGRFIEAANLEFQLAFEWIVAGEQAEDQHRQGKLITASSGLDPAQQHFRSHETRGTDGAAQIATINIDIVVVADQDAPTAGLQEQIAKRNVFITKPFEMQLMEGFGQEETSSQYMAQTDLQMATHMFVNADIISRTQRHHVAKTTGGYGQPGGEVAGERQQRHRPEKTLIRAGGSNALKQALLKPDVLRNAAGEIPLQSHRLVGIDSLIHLPLAATAEQTNHRDRPGDALERKRRTDWKQGTHSSSSGIEALADGLADALAMGEGRGFAGKVLAIGHAIPQGQHEGVLLARTQHQPGHQGRHFPGPEQPGNRQQQQPAQACQGPPTEDLRIARLAAHKG